MSATNPVPANHQTVRLSRGSHMSPEHGACVMELASLLAGERFSDHPDAVCKVLGAFLRTYNDGVDDDRRQDLLWVASQVVGTGGDPEVTRLRAEHCFAAVKTLLATRRRRRWLPRQKASTGTAAAAQLARLLLARGEAGHAEALALVDELVAMGHKPSVTVPLRIAPGRAAGVECAHQL